MPKSNEPQMDWVQVALMDGAAPCFFIEGPEFCGRAASYPGHGNVAFHDYVSLQDFVSTAQAELARRLIKAHVNAAGDYAQAERGMLEVLKDEGIDLYED